MGRGWGAVVAGFLLGASALACAGEPAATPTTRASAPEVSGAPGSPYLDTAPTTLAAAPQPTDPAGAYLAYWDMYTRVNNPPDASDPSIAQLTAGPALDALVAIVRDNAETGTSFRPGAAGRGAHNVEVGRNDGSVASLTDCFVDDGVVVAADGSVLDDAVVTKLVDATLVFQDGAWKVFQYTFVQRWEGVAGCAA